jgi:hypothetical protein
VIENAVMSIYGFFNKTFAPKRVYYKPQIMQTIQQGFKFQNTKLAKETVEIPAEFKKDELPDEFLPTPEDEPDVTQFRMTNFEETMPIVKAKHTMIDEIKVPVFWHRNLSQ